MADAWALPGPFLFTVSRSGLRRLDLERSRPAGFLDHAWEGPPEIGRAGDRRWATRCLHPSDGPRWNTRHEDLGCPRRMTGRAAGAWAPAPHQQCHLRPTRTTACRATTRPTRSRAASAGTSTSAFPWTSAT